MLKKCDISFNHGRGNERKLTPLCSAKGYCTQNPYPTDNQETKLRFNLTSTPTTNEIDPKMNTVIIINLDYEAFPISKSQAIWRRIEERMVHAGFSKNNRLFLTSMDSEVAYEQAREVIRETERELHDESENVVHFIRDMYGIPFSQIVDLTSPSANEIVVDFMSTGTFRKYFAQFNAERN